MANNDSTTVTNLEATPAVVGNSHHLYGKTRVMVETFEKAAGSNGDTFTFFPVPLDACVLDLEIVSDAITGATDYDFGFHLITDNDLGAVIDADILADGVDISAGNANWTSILFNGAGAKDQSEVNQKLWEDLGYASITAAREAAGRNEVYFVVTGNTVGAGSGTLTMRMTLGVE
jgi:hypothetical protein